MKNADDPGQHSAGDDVDTFVAQVAQRQVLVDCERLDEREAPRCERGPDRGGGGEHGIAGSRQLGTTSPRIAAPQSGCARNADTTYATKTALSPSSTCSTRRKPPRSTSTEIAIAARGTLR